MAGLREVQFQNQLQFNLNVPLTTSNISTHFHRPKPIVVERIADKAGQSAGFPITHLMNRGHGDSSYAPLKSTGDASQLSSFQFSALSADRLAAAVELAKRDVKKRKMQRADVIVEQRDESMGKVKTGGASHKERTIYGKKYWEKLKQTQTARGQKSEASWSSRKMKLKEHDRNHEPRDSTTQTPIGSPQRQAFLSNKLMGSQQERADSPPTRDTPSGTRLARVPKDEIEKLQQEMEMYLQQIESVERRVLSEHSTDFLRRQHRSAQGRDNELVEEEEERRQLRAGEQTARATRTIYNLRQQVKQIERDILLGFPSIRGTKKSQAVARLAAAHRGAVRALQMFVNQLPYQDLRGGLPSHYHELALLIRQLTMLSAQIPLTNMKDGKQSAEGKTGGQDAKTCNDSREKERNGAAGRSEIQNDLVAMLDRVEKLNVDWCQEIKSQNALSPQKRQKPPFVTNFNNVNKPLAVEKMAKFQGPSEHRDEWDRKALLRTSVRALMEGLEKSSGNQQQKSQQKTRQLAWDIPFKKLPHRKGLMLGKLKTRKRQDALHKQHQREEWKGIEGSTHFAEPTITANLKAATPLQNPFTHDSTHSLSAPSSPRARNKDVRFGAPSQDHHHHHPGAQRGGGTHGSLSSRSCHSCSHSPRLQRNRSRSPSPGSRKRSQSPQAQRRRFFVQDVDSELVNELFQRQKISRQSRKDKSQPQGGPDGNGLLRRADVSESFISEVERRVMNHLKPLLDEAKDSGRANDEEERERLAEMILDDVVEEAAQELQAMEQSNSVRRKAASLLDNPTLENIHQRLEEMEKEHFEIRQRWTSVTYHDPMPTRHWRSASKSVTKSEQPRDPPAFEVTRLLPGMTREPCRMYPERLSEEPLMFTKDSKAAWPRVNFEAVGVEHADRQFEVPQRPSAALASKITPRPRKLLSMKQTVVEKICDHAERFDYFQRGLRHHLGNKEGWRIVESLADQILDECFDEVTAELEHISTAMAEHIYTSEFMDQNGLPLAPPELASDFIAGGSAAQNLRDSAVARQQVEDAFSRMDLGSPHLQHRDDASPVNPTSLRNIFDATDLYEASDVDEISQASNRLTRTSKSKDDDTQLLDDDYDDDFSDISDEDETDDEGSSV